MTVIKAHIYTGLQEATNNIIKALKTRLLGFAIELISDPLDADIIVTRPEYIHYYTDYAILVLTDSSDSFDSYENVVDYSPFPLTDDDYSRLEFRLVTTANSIRD